MENNPTTSTVKQSILCLRKKQRAEVEDTLIVEEPLEIRIVQQKGGQAHRNTLSITMRTPGDDEALALGFLLTEGIIGCLDDVIRVEHPKNLLAPETRYNVIDLYLRPGLPLDKAHFNRHFYTTSSCGVCGKGSIELVHTQSVYLVQREQPVISCSTLLSLPDVLRREQSLFAQTGGVHAVGLFTADGRLLDIREDVGRHNAMDKLIGAALLRGDVPMRNSPVLVSGRASFELVQKAYMAGIPVLAAVGAPSSLAVALAEDSGMTLAGFIREDGCNLYTGAERIR